MVLKKKYSRLSGKFCDFVEVEDVMNIFDDVIGYILWDLKDDWEEVDFECK